MTTSRHAFQYVKLTLLWLVLSRAPLASAQDFDGFLAPLEGTNENEIWLSQASTYHDIENAIYAGYKIIHLPAKTYNTGVDTLRVTNVDGWTLLGEGIGNTIIQSDSGTADMTFWLVGCDNVRIEGISFYYGQDGNGFRLSNRVTMTNCEIAYGGAVGFSMCDYVTFTYNWSHDSGFDSLGSKHGVEISNPPPQNEDNPNENTGHFVAFNRFENNILSAGIEMWGANESVVLGNYIDGSDIGIRISDWPDSTETFGILVHNNIVLDTRIGIDIIETVRHNTFTNNYLDQRGYPTETNYVIYIQADADSNFIAYNTIFPRGTAPAIDETVVGSNTILHGFREQYVTEAGLVGHTGAQYVLQFNNVSSTINTEGYRVYRKGQGLLSPSAAFTQINAYEGGSRIVGAYTGGGGGLIELNVSDGTTASTRAQFYNNITLTPASGYNTIWTEGTINASSTMAGSNAFTTTAETDTVVVAGAAATDLYQIVLTGTGAPLAADACKVQARSGDFVVHRAAAGTSGLTYNWLRLQP